MTVDDSPWTAQQRITEVGRVPRTGLRGRGRGGAALQARDRDAFGVSEDRRRGRAAAGRHRAGRRAGRMGRCGPTRLRALAEPASAGRPGRRMSGRPTMSRSICYGWPGPTRPAGPIGGAGPRSSPCSPPVSCPPLVLCPSTTDPGPSCGVALLSLVRASAAARCTAPAPGGRCSTPFPPPGRRGCGSESGRKSSEEFGEVPYLDGVADESLLVEGGHGGTEKGELAADDLGGPHAGQRGADLAGEPPLNCCSLSGFDAVDEFGVQGCVAEPGPEVRTPARPAPRITRAIRLWLTRSPASRSSAVILGTP